MNICKATYQDSLLQVANSMRCFVGLAPYHSTCKEIEEWIHQEDIKQIVLLVIDGMGVKQMKEALKEDDFFNAYLHHPIQTVMPSTTVAATMCLRTGCTPAQSRYLGWHQYQDTYKDSMIMFHSKSYYQEGVSYPGVIKQKYPYETIVEQAQKNKIKACECFPYWKGSDIHTIEELCKASLEALKQGNRYVYSYWDGYDAHMHRHGVYTSSSKDMLVHIESCVTDMTKSLPEHCGLLVVADHGHIDVETCSLLSYPDIIECFVHAPTLEMRFVNFYIKETHRKQFVNLFSQYFNDTFQLFTHQEVIDEKLFGNLQNETSWYEEVGDFIAVATSKLCLSYTESYVEHMKGNHAGMSEAEMMVPLILYPVQNKK